LPEQMARQALPLWSFMKSREAVPEKRSFSEHLRAVSKNGTPSNF